MTDDLYRARNTLTHRIRGPTSIATIALDKGKMKDGDRAGLVLLRDSSAWIGVKKDNGVYRVSMVSGLSIVMGNGWESFPGYRYGVFSYATDSLGGSAKVSSFGLSSR